MVIDGHWLALMGIDCHGLTMIVIDGHCWPPMGIDDHM
jgi:hypothetical protein